MTLLRCILVVLLLLCPMLATALDVPPLVGRVNDQARLLSPEAAQRLEQQLALFERDTSNQVVVLTVASLNGDNIDQFAIRVADAWKVGQKGKDNGVILLIAQAERKVRIEVGMGLQGALPDITAGRIIRDVMRPHLKEGNYERGIAVGVESIIAATKGEFKAEPRASRQQAGKKSTPSLAAMLLGAVVAVAIAGLFSRYFGALAGAVGFPLAAYVAFPTLQLLTLALLAVGGLVAGLLLSMLVAALFSGGGGYGGGGFGGGWGGGFYGGGFGGGSSGSDDSFSGGGGDFDGGGSSDDF